MGEEPWRIFNVGAPQLDEVIHGSKIDPSVLAEMLELKVDDPMLIVLQHPVLAEVNQTRNQMIETMQAIEKIDLQTVVIYPNVDAAGQEIIDVIHKYEHLPLVRFIRNLESRAFISLLAIASVIVGNSSCGILEAPSFKLAAVNIGNRQRGRMQACNVINVPHDRDQIANAITMALYDEGFKDQLRNCVNPYGDGFSSERVVKVLSEIPIDQRLLDKKITY